MKLIEDLGMLYPTINSKQKKRFAIYQCDCGNEFKAQPIQIKKQLVKSCGCFKSKIVSERNTKHGLRHHRLYSIWKNMIQRCNNSKERIELIIALKPTIEGETTLQYINKLLIEVENYSKYSNMEPLKPEYINNYNNLV